MLKRIQVSKAAAIAMAAAGLVYFVLSILPWLKPLPLMPVAKSSYAAGSFVSLSDMAWVPWHGGGVGSLRAGYLAVTVSKGQALSPAMFTAKPPAVRGVLVDIPVSSPLTQAGKRVEVFIISPSGKLWQSGPLQVFKAPSGGGIIGTGGSPLIVVMTLAQAVQYEKASLHGTVSVVGMQS